MEDKDEKEDLDRLRKECLVPFVSHEAVKVAMLDEEMRAKCKKLVRLTVRNVKGYYAIHFLDALLSPFIKGKVMYTDADKVVDEGPHYYMGQEVYHLVPEFTQFFYDCLDSHVARQNDPTITQDKIDQKITNVEAIRKQFKRDFVNARNLWKEDLLPEIEKMRDDPLNDNNAYWDIVYKDAKHSLKILYDVTPPDLNDEYAVVQFVDEHKNTIDVLYSLRDKSSVEGVKKRRENKIRKRHAQEAAALKQIENQSPQAQAILATGTSAKRFGAQPGSSQVGLHQGAAVVQLQQPQPGNSGAGGTPSTAGTGTPPAAGAGTPPAAGAGTPPAAGAGTPPTPPPPP